MFSPLENDSLDNWFQRLNAPLKRLPAEERTQLHQEVRQHLEALAAANEELGSAPEKAWEQALIQFGEPTKFGKRMVWEWRCKHGFLSPQVGAILYGIAVCSASMVALAIVNWLVVAVPYWVTYWVMNIILNSNPSPLLPCGLLGIPVVTGAVIGLKYPREALKGAFYAACIWPGLPALALFSCMLQPCLISPVQIYWPNFLLACFAFPVWLTLTCGAAYLASVMKRGWYRPTWDDFKLTLPKRRRLLG
ncbi:MAG: permease prefix domain 1-containing protein [Janthinobacterium lividum]